MSHKWGTVSVCMSVSEWHMLSHAAVYLNHDGASVKVYECSGRHVPSFSDLFAIGDQMEREREALQLKAPADIDPPLYEPYAPHDCEET